MNDVLDWDLLISSRLNAILCGNRSNLDVTFSRLCAHLALPLHEWSFVEGSPLPSITKGYVDGDGPRRCDSGRAASYSWNGSMLHRAVRVITLSEVPLFDFVAAGALLEQLYYRLNPIYCALDRNCGSGSEATRRDQRDPNPRTGSSAPA